VRACGKGRGVALCSALAADVLIGDPEHPWHPTAVAGQALAAAYGPWRHRRPFAQLVGGTVALAFVAGAAGVAAAVLERSLRRIPAGAVALGIALKPTFAVRELLAAGGSVADALEDGDLDTARTRVGMIVSRPTEGLRPDELAAAAIESLAENLGDSMVGPLFAFAVAGLPGAAIYRVVNTADSMYGYHDEREWLGKSAAHVDDLLNLVPSRASMLALAAAALITGRADAAAAMATARRDHRRLASPNAGWPIAAMAGALGRRLEKPGHYAVGEDRPAPGPEDIRRASAIVVTAAALLTVVLVRVAAC
jgi:adenosylcobinamide-phosphate synthase